MGPGAAGAILGIESRRNFISVVGWLFLNGDKSGSGLEVGQRMFDGSGLEIQSRRNL
jgi:hypothetical protein